MQADLLGAMGSAFGMLTEASTLFHLFIGVLIGSLLSVIPGVGGLMGMALLLPFTFSMSPVEAMAFLVAAMAVMSTADSIPAILFGVPGTPTSMVTVLDGYPMAKRGEAGRALGAAFTSSVVGGVIGALVLVIIIPVVLPILMGSTSPELLAFCIMGLAMVGALAGGSIAKGLGASLIGVLLAFIGQEDTTATLRWTFDTIYLWDGLHILVMALGIYALPELADLAIQNKSIASDEDKSKPMKGVTQGARDTYDNAWPVARNSVMSSLLGIIPAIGPSIIPWLIYSYTTMRSKVSSNFGKGDVRGVIASESSNNATVGGSLLPTVALGVPGSAPMALLLGAMLLHGIAPGPNMLSSNLDMTYMMVWGIVAANIVGGFVALAMAKPLSRVVFVRSTVLVPLITSVVFIGAVQSTRQWEDGLFLLLVGFLGWVMKRVRWPRAPLFLAFILAPLVEKYYFISMNVHGWGWTLRPAVAVLLAITALFILGVIVSRVIKTRKALKGKVTLAWTPTWNLDVAFSLGVMVMMILAYFSAGEWRFDAGIMPRVAATLGFLMALFSLLGIFVTVKSSEGETAEEVHFDLETDFGELTPKQILLGGVKYLALLAWFGVLAWSVGLIAALPVYLISYMLLGRERLKLVLPLSLLFWGFCWFAFVYILDLAWPAPLFTLF
ncbi:tripartite tricarboxylate transporter permease [Saccharospirillum sp.]|uniref:tripartite tricarboxylate transporter permease n=1 Tax=Saccharospirillum sp. TaxID=2033801 RepID=UPI0034A09434